MRALGCASVSGMLAMARISEPGVRRSAAAASREARIQAIAARQLRLVTVAQLEAAGLSARGAQKRAERGHLHRLHLGVYSTQPPPFSLHQRWLAAVLACGPDAFLSDEPAAVIQGILDERAMPPQVTVPGGRGRSRPGIVVHDRGPVDPRDRRRFDSI